MTDAFIFGKVYCCDKCGKPVDVWTASLSTLKQPLPLEPFAFIGALTTHFQFTMVPGRATELDLRSHGVPNRVRILAINYTPQGSTLFPVQAHGNQLHEGRQMWAGDGPIYLWPSPFDVEQQTDTVISCAVTWTHTVGDDPTAANLIEAFLAYVNERYLNAIIPANVAVESRLARALKTYLATVAGKKRVDDFLENAATYSHQLNVVMPLIAKLCQFPDMPEIIREKLNALRGLRNDLGHDGKTKAPVAPDDAAELLAAAAFGIRYIETFEDVVMRASKTRSGELS